MAGEWLKFDASTPEKPEVFSITVAMGWDDPDLTVGKLLKVWRWFDQQTIDGNAPSVTLALLDRISGVSGFAQAMCKVGWLLQDGAGISLPNFDRHNGKTAKDRCLTAKRVAKFKSNAGGNDGSVNPPLPKEEKRREEEPLVGEGADLAHEERRKTRRPSDEDHQCAVWLYDALKKVNPAAKKPNWQTWGNEVRLMREIDGRAHREICELFKWAKSDSFWSPNIQSPGKLREKWDTLTEKRTSKGEAAPTELKKDWI